MLTKNSLVQIKAGPKDDLPDGYFAAYASVFGNVDRGGDVVAKGAFAKSLTAWEKSGDPIPLLFGHNMSDPDFNIGHIVKASEDDHGLLVEGQLDLESPKAQQVYRLLKGRRLRELSFAYDIEDASMAKSDDLGDFYELRQLKLHEVSLVPMGMNPDTSVLGVKAAVAAIETDIKAGRAISAKNETELRKAHDAIGAVLAALGEDSEPPKTSGTESVKDEEPVQAKSDEPIPTPSVDAWAAELTLIDLEGITS